MEELEQRKERESDRPAMNRHILAAAAASHVHSLVDPYVEAKEHPLLCVPVAVATAASHPSSELGGAKKAANKKAKR